MAKKEKQPKQKKQKKQKPVPQPQWLENPLKNPARNYHVYVLSRQENLLYSLLAFVVGGAVGLVFYGGLFKKDGLATTLTLISNVMVFVIVGVIAVKLFLPIRADQLRVKRVKELRKQFRDMLGSLMSALSANSTVSDAFSQAYTDMTMQYSNKADIVWELYQIVEGGKNNVEPEVMLADLADRSDLEDIRDFSNVFAIVNGPGGRIKDVMHQTHQIISDKMRIEDEIDSKMSANQLELNVITLAPIAIVAMLRFSNPTFAENFATPIGVVVMTAAIGLFVLSYKMGQKIVQSVKG